MRCSAYITDGADIVIDTGPEFRIQAIKNKITHLDCVLITHSHADHVYGMDDLRIFSHTKAVDSHASPNSEETPAMPIYANSRAVEDIRYRFDYVFQPTREGGGKPKFELHNADHYDKDRPIVVKDIEIIPVPIRHGSLIAAGYLLNQYKNIQGKKEKHSIAYLTDCNCVENESIELIRDNAGILDFLVIDALREKPHSTHFGFDQALEVASRICAKNTYFTHMSHNFSHVEIQEYIDGVLACYPGLLNMVKSGGCVSPAYDGLELVV